MNIRPSSTVVTILISLLFFNESGDRASGQVSTGSRWGTSTPRPSLCPRDVIPTSLPGENWVGQTQAEERSEGLLRNSLDWIRPYWGQILNRQKELCFPYILH